MSDLHIVSQFQSELDAIKAKIIKMGGLVEASIVGASASLYNRDAELAEHVRASDAAIDTLEQQINDEAARVIALRSPNAEDLRLLLTVIKVSGNLERIADYSKNIAKRTRVLLELRSIDGSPAALRRMAREVELMLGDALNAYVQQDQALALSVIARDESVDQIYNTLFREFLTFMMEDPRNITACMHLHFIAKNIERMGDHVTSIAEQVVFYTSGEKPTDERTKADVTSSDAALSGMKPTWSTGAE